MTTSDRPEDGSGATSRRPSRMAEQTRPAGVPVGTRRQRLSSGVLHDRCVDAADHGLCPTARRRRADCRARPRRAPRPSRSPLLTAASTPACSGTVQRDAEASLALAISLLEVAEEHGFRIWIAAGNVLRGSAQVSLGNADAGLAGIRSGMAQYQVLRSPPIFWPFLLYYGSELFGRAPDRWPRKARDRDRIAQLGNGTSMLGAVV